MDLRSLPDENKKRFIAVSSISDKWSAFEKCEWHKVDTEHYGQPLSWKKRHFKIAALEGKKVIGTLRLEVQEGIAYIVALIVAEELRGTGVGKQLMEKAEQTAREYEAHKIYLHTGATWTSLPFYQGLGYAITCTLPNHYAHVDFVEMTKFL